MATYGVAEITQAEGMMVVERRGDIDVDALSEQLMDIRNAISPILTEEPEPGGLALQSLEISLTVGVDRKVLPLFTRVRGKGFSTKSLCSILYRKTRTQPITLLGVVLRTECDYDILDGRIKMRRRGYIALPTLRYILEHAAK
jgi:hypothetical protein